MPSTVVGPTPDQSAVLVGAGDIGLCGSDGAAATGRLLDAIPGTVVALGDIAYPSGTAGQFRACYDPVWGRHKHRTRPAPGNHEYESPFAQPYFDYFGENAGLTGLGYYSFTAGPWFVLSLNSNVPSGRTSEQGLWVRSELQAQGTRCTLAYFHYPLISSGPNGDTPAMAELWSLLYEFGVDVVLVAHEHLYERMAPISPAGDLDVARGIRQFTVGTGGSQLSSPVRTHPRSERIISGHGVLRLTLNRDAYEWAFIGVNGVLADTGVGACH
jgi:hypothetical protein